MDNLTYHDDDPPVDWQELRAIEAHEARWRDADIAEAIERERVVEAQSREEWRIRGEQLRARRRERENAILIKPQPKGETYGAYAI